MQCLTRVAKPNEEQLLRFERDHDGGYDNDANYRQQLSCQACAKAEAGFVLCTEYISSRRSSFNIFICGRILCLLFFFYDG